MRFIEKTALPKELSDALKEAQLKGWSWDEFGKQNSDANVKIREFLMSEQDGLCGYSEISLKEFGCHTEHIKPKGNPNYKHLELDYENLIASAPANEKNIESRRDLFGGHKKAKKYDDKLFVSPTETGCNRFFQYTPDGSIEPDYKLSANDRLRAMETIDCLGLQSSRLLINKRRRIYRFIQNQLESVIDQPDIMEAILSDYFKSDANGNLKPFQSLVRQIAGQ